jgi:hypothetical protein
MPAIKMAFHKGTPATAPAPMTPNPDAAKVANILNEILCIVFIFPSYSNGLEIFLPATKTQPNLIKIKLRIKIYAGLEPVFGRVDS